MQRAYIEPGGGIGDGDLDFGRQGIKIRVRHDRVFAIALFGVTDAGPAHCGLHDGGSGFPSSGRWGGLARGDGGPGRWW